MDESAAASHENNPREVGDAIDENEGENRGSPSNESSGSSSAYSTDWESESPIPAAIEVRAIIYTFFSLSSLFLWSNNLYSLLGEYYQCTK